MSFITLEFLEIVLIVLKRNKVGLGGKRAAQQKPQKIHEKRGREKVRKREEVCVCVCVCVREREKVSQ